MSTSQNHWAMSTIGHACKTVKGKKPNNSGPRSDERTVPYINIKAFEARESDQYAEVGAYPMCNESNVLIVWDGARSGLVGRGVSGYIGSTLARVHCGSLSDDFLFYFLQSQYGEINSRTKGVGIPHVDPQVFEAIKIPLPPKDDQRTVVSEIEKQFTRLEAGVAALRRVQANLKRYRAAVLKAACEGRLVPTEAELQKSEHRGQKSKAQFETGAALLARILTERRQNWQGRGKYKEPSVILPAGLPTLPSGWAWASMRQVGEVQLGRQRAPQHHTGDNMRPYLRVANVFEARIDTSDVKEMNFTPTEFGRYRLRHGDILLNEGQTPELVGRPAMFRDEVAECCYQKTLLRFRAYVGVLPQFALTVFRAYMHNQRFTRAASITTNIAHLTAEKFVEIEFPLPPLAEQTRIVAEVERRLSVVEELESVVTANLQRATRLRQSILQKAFSGELI
jgi:type I restriction enzyme S subunit